MTTEQKKQSNIAAEAFPTIDVLKFIFAILIMCLHGRLFKGSLQGLFFEKIIVRLAVPFFFVSSGFFYGKKVYAQRTLGAITKNYISRLAEKLLIFEPISILIYIVVNEYHFSILKLVLKAIQKILFYPPGALWYIQAVIIAIILLVPFIKREKEKTALFLGLLLYLFALLCNRYYFLCEGTVVEPIVTIYMRLCISARNGVFMGLLYVSIGVLIAKKWDDLQQKKTLFSVLMLVSGICLVLEVCLTNNKTGMDDNALFIAHLILIPALFICAGCKQVPWVKNHINTKILRNLSTSIYLLHSPALEVVEYGFAFFFNVALKPWQITVFAGIIIVLICTLIYWKKWKPFYNWIK